MNSAIKLNEALDDTWSEDALSEEEIINRINDGVDVNIPVCYWYPLQLAIYREWSANVVKAIISAGADLNACANIDTNSDYYFEVEYGELQNLVPLSIAAAFGRSDIVKLLIEAGADVNNESSSERTPLDVLYELCDEYGCSEENFKIIEKLLLDAGAREHSA